MNRPASLLLATSGLLLLVASAVTACTAVTEEPSSEVDQEIVGGTEARGYEAAALIDIEVDGTVRSICSGALIAPRVVLTAGHCVVGRAPGFRVGLPYAGNQRVRSSRKGIVYDYVSTGGNVDPNKRDVGLVILDTPATLRRFPKIARAAVDQDTGIVKVGRIDSGRASNTALFQSRPMRVFLGGRYGYPYSYVSSEVIQPGDSGGPNFISGMSDTPTIVAVNSGAGGGTEVLARVDILAAWIDQQVARFGGYAAGDGGTPDGGAGGDGGVDGGADGGDARPDDGDGGSPVGPDDNDASVGERPKPDGGEDDRDGTATDTEDEAGSNDDDVKRPGSGLPKNDGLGSGDISPTSEDPSDDARRSEKTMSAGCSILPSARSGSEAATILLGVGLLLGARRRSPRSRTEG